MGSVVISVEVDPGLGDEPQDGGTSDGNRNRTFDAWRRASYRFDRREIPATWLVAGALFAPADPERSLGNQDADETDRTDGEPAIHANEDESERERSSRPMLPPGDEADAPPYVYPGPEEPTWSPRDSTGDWTRSVRSVPELIEGIQRSRVRHEIGCLPFSGLDIDGSSQGDAAVAVRATFDDAAALGVDTDWIRSFAFSDGRAGHHDVLAAYGFECYPGDPESESNSGGLLSSLATLLGLFARRLGKFGPRLVEPETDDHGLVTVPASMTLAPLTGRAGAIARAGRRDPVADLAKRGVDRAAEYDGVFHLSVRLADLRTEDDFDRLGAVLDHVADHRRETGLRVETLGQIARRLGEHAPTPAAPVR